MITTIVKNNILHKEIINSNSPKKLEKKILTEIKIILLLNKINKNKNIKIKIKTILITNITTINKFT
jgi:hypothetical protein